MSSHREAPEISKDPVADSTDTYAFVSPDRPGFVTLITNYIPLQNPAGGPNFFEFGDDVSYKINVDNNGDGVADVVYEFKFTTTVANPNTFLYNTGPIASINDPNFNRRQRYTVTRKDAHGTRTLAKFVPCPPCNIGPRSTPNYPKLAKAGHRAGQGRSEGVRRPAARRVLRRPRLGVRPARPAPVPEPAPAALGRRRRASTGCGPTTCTPWPSRCRSATSPSTGRPPRIRCRPPR